MGYEKQHLTIDGMHCDACVQRVSHVLGSVPGIRVNAVEVGTAQVLAQPPCEDRIRKALADQGFTLQEMHATS